MITHRCPECGLGWFLSPPVAIDGSPLVRCVECKTVWDIRPRRINGVVPYDPTPDERRIIARVLKFSAEMNLMDPSIPVETKFHGTAMERAKYAIEAAALAKRMVAGLETDHAG